MTTKPKGTPSFLAAGRSLGHAAGHKDHGSTVALDEVEKRPARPGSPVGIATPAGALPLARMCVSSSSPQATPRPTTPTRRTIAA